MGKKKAAQNWDKAKAKSKEKSLDELFHEDAKMMAEALNETTLGIQKYCSEGYDASLPHVERVIEIEQEQDRMSEVIIELIFGRELMVFSRPDRRKLVEMMDEIVDQAEKVMRRLGYHSPARDQEILDGINEMGQEIARIGDKGQRMLDAVLDDFDEAKRLFISITNVRRRIRDKQYELIPLLYKKDLNYKDFLYYRSIIQRITRLANDVQDFGDLIHELVVKYMI